MRAIGIGIPFGRRSGGVDAQAQAHFDRVIADGGLVPSGLSGVNAFFNTIKTIYGTSDINTAISVGLDPQVLGYKLGAGSGTTLGQAAQKLYSPKDVFGGIGTGNAYWEGSGVTGNFIQSNTSAYNTNDIDIEVQASTVATTGDVSFVNISNGTSTTVDFFYSKTNGVIQFQYYTGGFRNSFAVATIADGDIFRVTRNATTGSIVFRKNGIILTTSGAQVAGVLDFVNTTIKIGQGVCKINYANFYIAGVLNKTFNPNQYTGANTWTSTTSEVWTVNRTGAGLADVVQTTAASQPLLLAHNGSDNYYWGSGVAGNFMSTPNATANQITGDIEISAYIDNTGGDALFNVIGGKRISSGYLFAISSRQLQLYTAATTSSTVNVASNYIGWVKVFRSATTGIVTFYTSTDGITYTQLGLDRSTTAGNLIDNTTPLLVGSWSAGNQFTGKIYRFKIATSLNGTPVVDFNPNQYNAATSQTQWTSSTGEVWTINTGTATTGYKGILVDRTITMGDGINDRLTSGTLTSRTSFTVYIAVNVLSFSGRFMDGNSALTKTLYGTSSNISMFGGSGGFDFVGETPQRLQMLTANFQSAPNVYARVNNNARATTASSIGNSASTGINLFTDGGGANPANVMITTLIQSTTNDPLNDNMYNYIRSINNNAF